MTKQDKKLDKKQDFIRAVGRRKEASARVRLHPSGKGKIEINGQEYKKYFPTDMLQSKVFQPLEVTGKEKDFDFTIKVEGGGKQGQAEACRLGIARSMEKFNEDYRTILKSHGLLTRDSREKERKKPGLKKARRSPQWSKR